MITPPTSAHGSLSSFEARGTARAESATDFREEVARGRERVARREPRAEDREVAARDEVAPTETRDARTVEADAHADESAQTQDASPTADADPRRDDARSTATNDAPKPPSPRARTSPATEADAAIVAPSEGEASNAATPTPTVPIAVEPIAVHDVASSRANALPIAPASDGTVDAHAPATVAHAVDAAPTGTESVAAADHADPPRETRAVASGDSTPNHAPSAVTRAAPGVADVSPAQAATPAAPPRLAPTEIPRFLDTLQVRVDGAANSALVELEPPDLGKLTVELVLQPEGGVRAEVRAERPDGYAAMEARLPELRASLVDRGFASADVQLSFGLAQRDPRGDAETARSSRSRRAAPRELEAERVLALAPSNTASIDLWA